MAHEGKRHGFAASGNKSVAEILNANKNSVAELISQEMSNNLASTYSSGDAGLARQLEARTYGVNDDLSITPGTETKWVDEIGDKYGRSEQNVKIADEKAAAAEQLILDEKETIGSTAYGLSNSGTISKDDKKIFKDAKKQRLAEQRAEYRKYNRQNIAADDKLMRLATDIEYQKEDAAYQAKKAEKAVIDSIVADEKFVNYTPAGTDSTGQLASEKALIDTGQVIGLTTIKPTLEDIEEGVTVQTGSDVAQESFAVHKNYALANEQIRPTASDLAVESLPDKGVEELKQREKERAIAAHDKYQNDKIETIAKVSDEAAADEAKAKITAEAKAEDLARIQENLKGVIDQLEGTAVITKDGEKIYTAVDAGGDLLRDVVVGDISDGIVEGEILKKGTPQTPNAKMVAELKRAEYEKHAGEKEARQVQKGVEVLERVEEEKHGGDAEGAQLHKLTEIKDKLDKERDGGDFEGQRFANLPTDTSTLGMDADIRKARADAPKGTIYPGDSDNKVRGDQLPRLEKERLASQKKADEHSRTLGYRHQGVNKESKFRTLTRKEDSLAVQLAKHNMPMFMTDAEKQKMVSALDRIDEEREGGDDEASLLKWNKDPFRFSTFAYPRDVTTSMENGHYILFYVNVQNKTKYSYEGISETASIIPVGDQIMTEEWKQEGTGKYKTVSVAGMNDYEQEITKDVLKQSWKSGASKVFDTNIDYQRRRVLAGNKGNILRSNQAFLMKGRKSYQGLDSVHKSTTRITDSVALYLPPAVSDNTSVAYENQSLGMAGFLAFSFGEIVNKWKARDFEGVADTIFEMGGTALVESMRTMGLGAFGLITGADEGAAKATFDKAFGQAVNPYIEVTFNSMGMRDFSYTFNFSPKSKQETQDVQDIIALFRFHMAPELKGTNHRFLTLPSTFDIHYMYQTSPEKAKENQFYNKIATCVLTGCNVDYTPNGVRSFADGAPTQISMTLNFQETKMLTKQRINDGF